MKRQLLIISVLLFSMMGYSQGIAFEHGTWKDVLEKAKQTNKPVFVDVYTSWCGPCKMMSKDIFPLAEVGAVYNANFVCYQVDAEKGEGVEIAKKYEVKAYPTYLFIKPDGTLFSLAIGSMPVKDFISVSNTAIADMNDPKPLTVWDKEYAGKKNDPGFLLDYMNKRSKLGKSNALLLDEYLKLLPEERRTSDTIIRFYQKEEHYLNVNSLAYTNLLKNKDEFYKKLYENVYTYLYDGVVYSVKEAAKSKDEQLLHAAIQAFDKTHKNPLRMSKDELYMDYYKRTRDSVTYLKYTCDFCNNDLMNISTDSIKKKDRESLQQIEKAIQSGALAVMDSANRAQVKEYSAHLWRNTISEKLNNIAWDVFLTVSDINVLQDALRWSKRSLEIYPNNPEWTDTYANLFYKLGKKEEAIAKEEEAVQYAGKDQKKGFEETVTKMKSGVKTW